MSEREEFGWYHRGYLPHCDERGKIQHVVFHLWDSLPREALHRMEEALRAEPESGRNLKRQHRFHQLLDQGFGSCILREKFAAEMVENAIRYWDSQRYLLYAWVVMPNHVYVLLKPLASWKLGKFIQSWKRHTAREIRRGSSSGTPSCTRPGGEKRTPFWQRDYWDRFVRDENHFKRVVTYIEENPVKAGLAESPEAWPWGSARLAVGGIRRFEG